MIHRYALLIAAGWLAAAPVGAQQPYPSRPVRVIVPFSPGGASDTAARIVGQKLAERWGQQFVVENRPGAGGTIGTELAVKAAPDGYTLLMASSTELAINPHIYPKLTYDTLRDFAPVALVASTPLILVVHPSLPARSAKELVALARARPGQINYASSGNGSTVHLAGELLQRAAGVRMTHVPHKGSAPAVTSVMNGESQLMLPAMPAALPQARAGKLRALAVTSARRVAAAQDLPTLVESGYPTMEIVIWNGVVAPAKTPGDIIARLNTEIGAVLALPDVVQAFSRQGAEVTPAGSEAFGGYIKAEFAKFAKIVRDSGARID